ncbi:hypothetical protein MCOR27_002676 [Pyricularia oryzae]|uniref:UmuC domain-containing protein n=2 Tax=Pyricularia TaxID=48558 RepID=A0ABQ8N433_PYRGI|nr:hypothetical protein MCOR02_006477 [Pyricularia oryzae]KAI6290929.1 hypothetical protein MCOR33_010964 [Pyricularia grisea]KAI6253902.1 hypothetical protein MCOR19_009558 [Pyricularia oryzae]KAI6264592.1 hypothetical protein MCOR26_011235 [Pyricularia oryzae]KAI6284544.1 hypothetical protein MCOR27_002676 [Pyricularia oryzae]
MGIAEVGTNLDANYGSSSNNNSNNSLPRKRPAEAQAQPEAQQATETFTRTNGDDERIILHFDYDCFYAQVVENKEPSLKSLPVGIKQKSILATCNYVARRRGVKKLMRISEARDICPDLVLVDGEDLTPFRDTSKILYRVLRSFSWNDRAERLGLDEVFLDVSDMVSYNLDLLNPHGLANSFFCLSSTDPELGFAFDATGFAGCVVAPSWSSNSSRGVVESDEASGLLRKRLLLASHLAYRIRLRIEQEGYTSACGISVNKLLAKMVGSRNKPRNQTTLLALSRADTLSFVDQHSLRSLPGIGGSMAAVMEQHTRSTAPDKPLKAGQVRLQHDVSPHLLEKLLQPLGLEKGIGQKTYRLLHGIDTAEVKFACDFPIQIGIEDTYANTGLSNIAQITQQLIKLSASLIRRIRVDLTEPASNIDGPEAVVWVARPRTLRLTTRQRHPTTGPRPPYNSNRTSRSQPLPSFVHSSPTQPAEDLAARLVEETLLPMFHKLNPPPTGTGPAGYNIGLINICVTGMVASGADSKMSSGRDIAGMFRRQHEVLREFTAYDQDNFNEVGATAMSSPTPVDPNITKNEAVDDVADDEDSLEADWDGGSLVCEFCGHAIPAFAMLAHHRFHQLDGDG